VGDASVCLMISGSVQPPAGNDRRKRSLELLGKGQSEDGGWGPRTQSPPEPFDTALVLLGLAKCGHSPNVLTMIARGRAFLVAQQQTDGSWIETTRPSGNVSYAQRISTTGWATQALLATRKPSAVGRNDPKR
jgi:Squalene-hopene cyclase C-terminal domain